MTVVFATKYRPQTWSEITGQKPVRLVLQQMVKTGDLPPALLFSGSRGTGKTTVGRILGAALNCEEAPAGPCLACPSCKAVASGTSLDVIEVDAASNGLVEDIRALKRAVMYSVGGAWRVVILDEAHSMSRDAFNALLKVLEEPPPQTIFLLLTTEPGRILATVQSRCMTFEFRRLSTADIVTRLQYIVSAENLPATPELLLTIANRSNGGMRDAVKTLDHVSRVSVSTPEQFAVLMGESDVAPGLAKALIAGDYAVAYGVVDEFMTRVGDASELSSALVTLFREMLVLRSGGTIARQGAELEVRQSLAARVEPERALGALRVLWDLKTKVRVSDDPRAALDLAVAMVSEVVVSRVSAPTTNGTSRVPLSLSQMAALVPHG